MRGDTLGTAFSQNDVKFVRLLNDNSSPAVPFVAFIEEVPTTVLGENTWVPGVFVKKLVSGTWTYVGSGPTSPISKGPADILAFAMHGAVPYVAYLGDNKAETGAGSAREMRIFVKSYNSSQNAWVGVGPDGGRVSNFGATSVSLALSALGVPHLAYVGQEQFNCADNIFECPAGETTIKPKMLVVKKWNGSNWVSISPEYASIGKDYVPVFTAGVAILKMSGETPYLAYDYDYISPAGDRSEERAVAVRKFVSNQFSFDNSHWIPVANVATPADESQARILFMSRGAGDFDLEVESSTPYLAFISDKNDNKATVIRHNGTKWFSLGSPAFKNASYSGPRGENLDLTMQPGNPDHPFVAIINDGDDHDGEVGVMKFCDPCKDASLSLVSTVPSVQLEWDFKQYFLFYRGSVAGSTSQISLTAVPNACSDMGTLALIRDGVVQQEFTSGLCAGVTATVTLNPGQNRFSLRGIDTDGKNSVQYNYEVFRPADINTTGLSFEFRDAAKMGLPLSPGFSIANSGPYTLPEITPEQSIISIIPRFSGNMTVIINGKHSANGVAADIFLSTGANQIKAEVYFNEQLLGDYTFQVNKLGSGAGSPALGQIVTITNAQTGAVLGTVYSGVNGHILNVQSEVKSILLSKAAGNTGFLEIDGTVIPNGQGLQIDKIKSGQRVAIISQASGMPEEPHVVIINIIGAAGEVVIIGHPEARDPVGLYDYPNLAVAFQSIQSYLNTTVDAETPVSYLFYAIADWGTDIISSPQVDIVPFQGQQKTMNIEIIGVIKGSQQYLDLVQQHGGGI